MPHGNHPQMFEHLLREFTFNPDIFKILSLRVAGMEVTQGIQYYNSEEHLTDSADRGTDNGLRLVAAKPAWVRVYVGALFADIPNATATLQVYRRFQGFLWQEVADLSPEGSGVVTAETNADYATVRRSMGSTLNFVIPADIMCGTLKLIAKVTAPGGHAATYSITIDVTLRQTLSMRIVPVSYSGVDGSGNPLNLPAPTLANAQATAGWSTTVYPVESTPSIGLTASAALTFPLTGSPATAGGCAQSWINLNVLVAQAKTADGNQPNTFYYGLVPSQVPIGVNSGCASSGVTSGRVGGGITMAHEFGHALGFQHAPCGGVGASADPNYPAYEPYDPAGTPGGSIGEYGLDINTGNVKDPAMMRDFMGYCNPDWISIYNHARSIQNPILQPRFVCKDKPWWFDEILYDPWWWIKHPFPERFKDLIVEQPEIREPIVSIIGVMLLGGKLEIRSTTRAFANPQVLGGQPTDLIAELLDKKGERLGAARVMRLPSYGSGCGCCDGEDRDDDPAIVQVYLPAADRGARLRIVDGDKEVWALDAPKGNNIALRIGASITKACGLDVEWHVDGDSSAEVWIRCTSDDSEPAVIHIAQGSGRAVLDLGQIPPGKARIDAVVHDGFDVVASKSVSLQIPTRPASVVILHPLEKQTLEEGRTMRLHGIATSCDGTFVEPRRCRWILDGEVVGEGPDVWIEAPKDGEHDVVFIASDTCGESKTSVKFLTVSTRE